MPQLEIESNGRLERTAVYINGEQVAGLKEVFLNLEEDGTFNSAIQYIGSDKKEYTKNPFSDTLQNIQVTEPSFTEEEALELQKITIDSDGFIEETDLLLNDEYLDGVVSIFVHVKAPDKVKSGIFGKTKESGEEVCKCEIIFRNEDDSLETVIIF